MKWEVMISHIVVADEFFEAIEKVKNREPKTGEVMSVCPIVEEDPIEE